MVSIAVTGKPGVGKTTLCKKVWEKLSKRDVSGFITLELRRAGRRVGFEILDLKSLERITLASLKACKTKVGKYCVHVEEFEDYLNRASLSGDLIIIDEVGPMELKSKVFVKIVEELMNTDADKLFTIHAKSNHPIIRKIREEFEVYTIDERNRDEVAETVLLRLSEAKKC